MTPFAQLLHDLRMRHAIRQSDLADRMGYEQSYVSSVEVGKGPPTDEFVRKLIQALALNEADATAVREAADASSRKVVIEGDVPLEVFWMLKDLRRTLPHLDPAQIRIIREVLGLQPLRPREAEPLRRIRRRKKIEVSA
jgi:transcriptional regulator with XRE-family HTH domain